MTLFLGLIITNPIPSLLVACGIMALIAWAVWSSGAKQRAIRRESETYIAKLQTDEEQRKQLVAMRYDPEIAMRILRREFWQGMTEEQLRDSLGPPEGVDTTVTKTKKKEVWKYDQITASRFGTRITLEGGVITGWTQK